MQRSATVATTAVFVAAAVGAGLFIRHAVENRWLPEDVAAAEMGEVLPRVVAAAAENQQVSLDAVDDDVMLAVLDDAVDLDDDGTPDSVFEVAMYAEGYRSVDGLTVAVDTDHGEALVAVSFDAGVGTVVSTRRN